MADKTHNSANGCKVRVADWPYECRAKDKHPEHVVYVCDTHVCWWHEEDHQPADV